MCVVMRATVAHNAKMHESMQLIVCRSPVGIVPDPDIETA